MLTTIENVKAYAKRRYLNFDYTNRYPDDVITDIIEESQDQIETETGHIFDKQTPTDEKFNYQGKTVNLNYYPVISVESVTINGKIQDLTKIRVNKKAGILYLDKLDLMPFGWSRCDKKHDIITEYTAGYETPKPAAKALCTALTVYTMYLERETPPSIQNIIQDSNNDVNTKIDRSDKIIPVVFDIENRFKKLPKKAFQGMI